MVHLCITKNYKSFPEISQVLVTRIKFAFESIMGKEENASNQGPYSPTILKNILSLILAKHFRAQPSTGETQESMNNVSCRRDMTEILLKVA